MKYHRAYNRSLVGEDGILDLFEAIRNRRSIRAFEDKPVSENLIRTLVDAARHAPSAGNIQPWEFIIVRDQQMKRQLSEAALEQSFVADAPIVIVVCADKERSGQGYGNRGVNLYCIQDTAAATQNMLLAAYALGLGSCWVGAFREEPISRALNIPAHVRPVAMIPVGYAAENPASRRHRGVGDIIHHDTFQASLTLREATP